MTRIRKVELIPSPLKTVATQTEYISPDTHNEIVSIDVGGQIFKILQSSLDSVPGTALSNLTPEHPAYQRDTGCYFFDRNPFLFQFVLDAFRVGRIHFPHSYCHAVIRDELYYWGVSETALNCCCFTKLRASEVQEKNMMFVAKSLKTSDVDELDNVKSQSKWQKWRLKCWYFLEDPNSSIYAKIWGVFYLLIIIVHLGSSCLQTHPYFRRPFIRYNSSVTQNITNTKLHMYFTTSTYSSMQILDEICITIFMLEWIIRFLVCFKKGKFLISVYNFIDALAILPTLVDACIGRFADANIDTNILTKVLFALSILSIFRVIRLLKFGRNFVPVRILFLSLKESLREILLLLIIISTGMLIFATMIYWAEFYTHGDFENIPIALWWSLITMTTVGYGDMYPSSGWGYMVGGICAVVGMLCTGLPIPIIANNFSTFYNYADIHIATVKSKKFTKIKHNVSNKLAFISRMKQREENDKNTEQNM